MAAERATHDFLWLPFCCLVEEATWQRKMSVRYGAYLHNRDLVSAHALSHIGRRRATCTQAPKTNNGCRQSREKASQVALSRDNPTQNESLLSCCCRRPWRPLLTNLSTIHVFHDFMSTPLQMHSERGSQQRLTSR